MPGAEAPLDVLVVDDVAERHDSYRDVLSGVARRVVAVGCGEDARQLYGDGAFSAAVVHLDGVENAVRVGRRSISAVLGEGATGPPVIVVSEEMPNLDVLGKPSARVLEYVPASFVPQLLASRISCLVELERLKRTLADRDLRLAGLESEVARFTEAAADERRRSDALKARVGEQIHRSKNLLAIMQSIARRTITDGREIPEARDILMGRLRALGRAHHLVTAANGGGTEIHDIVEAELADVLHRVATSGPRVRLASSAVQTFMLAIHELSTNAIKHGALGVPDGKVSVGWTLFEYGADRYLEVAWSENGGLRLDTQPTYGFGLALVSSFGGSRGPSSNITFGSDGLTCRMRLPMDALVVDQN